MNHNISVVPSTFIKSPSSSFKLFRNLLKVSFLRGKRSNNFSFDHTKSLTLVYFKLTPLCNLNCLMCGQRGIKGALKGKYAADEAKTILPLDVYKRFVDEIAPYKPVTYLWGGEPFLYPDLFPLARYIAQKGLYVAVNTNGTLIEKHAQEIVRGRWNTLFVSLDGFRDVNDAMRGAGSYDNVIRGFKALEAEKKRQNSALPFVGVVTTVTNQNYLYLDKLAESLREFDFVCHMFNLGTYTNSAIVQKQTEFMKSKFNVETVCLPAFDTGFNTGIDGQRLYDILRNIHGKDWGHPMITVPALNPEKIAQYYGELEAPVRKNCVVPWCQANVNYNGDVHFCADYPEYVLGNIKEQSFADIFNGERANLFREELYNCENGMFPGCLRCYQNMLFGEKIKGY